MRTLSIVAVLFLLLLPAATSAEPTAREAEMPEVGPDVPAELPASVYRARRAKLMKQLGGCVAAIKSYPSSDLGLDPYFYYLTGVKERGAMLLLSPKSPIVDETLFLQPVDPESEIWTGYREELSPELAAKHGVDSVRRVRGSVPRGLGRGLRRSRCYAKLRPSFADKPAISSSVLGEYLGSYQARSTWAWEELELMRAVHDDEEIVRMEKAIAITKMGHEAAILHLLPGNTERVVASKIEDAFYSYGATGLAFPSIVGAGPSGAILHWPELSRTVAEGDIAVVDIGASYGGYAADITRTYPASGAFSPEQLKIYNAVLEAQQKVIDAVRPGISLDRLHQIGDEAIAAAGYALPHSIGHFVGLEVHDVGDSSAPLEAGMVITVEPGIYIKGKHGVRIEDMVLVTPRGARVMTDDLPRTAAEVEAWMKAVRARTP